MKKLLTLISIIFFFSCDSEPKKVCGWEFFNGECNPDFTSISTEFYDMCDENNSDTYAVWMYTDYMVSKFILNNKTYYPELFKYEPFIDYGNGIWDDAEFFLDYNENSNWDVGENFIDLNGNGIWDDAEKYTDLNFNGQWDVEEYFTDIGNGKYDGEDDFSDLNGNGIWDDFSDSNYSWNGELCP